MLIIWITRYIFHLKHRFFPQPVVYLNLVYRFSFVSFQQNNKAEYANVFMDHLVSWNAALARMARAQAFVNLGEPKIPVA